MVYCRRRLCLTYISHMNQTAFLSEEENIREPSTSAADCNVKNEVEFLIKWRVGVFTLNPWIGERRTIFYATLELTPGPHILQSFEINIEDLLERIIDISVEIVLCPFNTIGMEAFREIMTLLRARVCCFEVGIVLSRRTFSESQQILLRR
jgi:hypothetical protein